MTTRQATRRTTIAVTAAVAAGVMLLPGGQLPSVATTASPSLTAMEHEAHRHLLQAQQEQAQQLNRKTARAAQADALRTTQAACRVRLEQAWQDLGRFSDAYETYLMRIPPCSELNR